MKKILVVEDNPVHLQDARAMLEERVKEGAIEGYDIAPNLNRAYELLTTTDYDGIMTDVFFEEGELDKGFHELNNSGTSLDEIIPKYSRDSLPEDRPNGVKVAEYALRENIPVVMVTSTYHHNSKTEPVNKWIRDKGMQLVDKKRDDTDPRKEWRGAYLALAAIMTGKDNGNISLTPDGIKYDEKGEEITREYGNMTWTDGPTSNAISEIYKAVISKNKTEKIMEQSIRPLIKQAIDTYCQNMDFS